MAADASLRGTGELLGESGSRNETVVIRPTLDARPGLRLSEMLMTRPAANAHTRLAKYA